MAIGKGLLVLSALCVSLLFMLLYLETGPAWIMKPNDHGYYILFNSLNLLQGEPLGRIFYPASTNIAFGTLIIFIANIFSGGDITETVLANPEYYHRLYILAQFAVFFIVVLFSGLSVSRVTRRPALGILFMTAPLLLPASSGGLVLAGGMPELFMFIGGVAVAGFGALAMQNGMEEATQKRIAIWLGAAACFAIFSKFVAGALLLFPLLILTGWRARGVFILSCLVFSLLYSLPVWNEMGKLFGMYAARIPEFLAEGTQRSGDTAFIDIIATNYRRLSREISLFELGLWVVTGSAVIGLVYRRQAPETRILVASAITVWAGIILILIRPSPRYLYGYCGILSLGLVTSVYLLSRLSQNPWYQTYSRHGIWAISLLILLFIVKEFAPAYQRQHVYWRTIVDGATSLNTLLEEKYSDFAHIHTHQTNSKSYAYYISNFNSANLHAKALDKHVPKNVFFYQWAEADQAEEALSEQEDVRVISKQEGKEDDSVWPTIIAGAVLAFLLAKVLKSK